ncbi:AMP-binding enzyme [Diaporthe amygdali]|uniref:AMP-binding enzyme n=1 Tax=Phomopsis amygdali TaxID=1214568 RepID=UPI0022FE1F5D|nr:AMP-binding enzyme [Diaporthe amygdali]KAJ0121878.1 AMP-binding enzyme [Diaporthe amygdali]
MTFFHNDSLPPMPSIADNIPLSDFMFDERYGRRSYDESLDAYTCGLSGRKLSAHEQKECVELLSRALAKELHWRVIEASAFDKTIGVFAFNTTSQCRALFTGQYLLPVALKAAKVAGIAQDRIYLCEMIDDSDSEKFAGFRTVGQLIREGESLPELERVAWQHGQGPTQTAFLCYSSGTSGLPKAVMISHKNVIANIIQLSLFHQVDRDNIAPRHRDIGLGLLPQSHIYSLIIICHASTYRGDSVIVLPKFELEAYFGAIAKYRINTLYLVPPIIISMVNNLQTIRVWVGAAPLAPQITWLFCPIIQRGR